jgi:chaperonin GroES
MNIRPLQDRLIVECVEEETTTAGGIIIPDSASKEKPQEGVVIAAGKGKVTAEGKVLGMDVKVGDKVLFGKYAGSEIKVDGKAYLMMREDDILGVVEK